MGGQKPLSGTTLSVREANGHLVRLWTLIKSLPLLGRLWTRLVKSPRELERFLKFAIVGTIGAMVDFAVLNIMKLWFETIGLGEGWQVSWPPHQVQLVAAATISFTAAVLSNFSWNRLWTFPESRERPLGSQLVQFAIVNALGLIINNVLLVTTDEYIFRHLVSARLSYNLAKAFAIGVVLFWNFGVNRVWTYRGIE
jgi:putative flippase GtrA